MRIVLSLVLSTTFIGLVAACSGGDIAVGKNDQALKTQRGGAPTGNGSTCSWAGTDDAVSSDGTTSAPARASYAIGDDFKSLDGCNDCTCDARGIMCTLRECSATSPGNPGSGGQACPEIARICKDGTTAKSGPACSLVCPEDGAGCTEEAKQCPDGSSVVRTGPKCEFPACPSAVVCATDAKLCPDGTSVGRTGPRCEFVCPR